MYFVNLYLFAKIKFSVKIAQRTYFPQQTLPTSPRKAQHLAPQMTYKELDKQPWKLQLLIRRSAFGCQDPFGPIIRSINLTQTEQQQQPLKIWTLANNLRIRLRDGTKTNVFPSADLLLLWLCHPPDLPICLSLCLFFFCLVASSLSLSSRVASSLSLGPACLSLGNKEKMPAMRWNWNAAKARNIIIQTGRGALRMGDIKGGGSLLAWIINASKILIACTWNEFQTTTSDVGHCRSHMTNDWHADWAGDKSTPPTHYQPNPQPPTNLLWQHTHPFPLCGAFCLPIGQRVVFFSWGAPVGVA